MNSSVIITTYKRPDFLLRAVNSVLAQSGPTEVVVVDDNGLGTEAQLNTQKVLQPFLNKITYLPLEKNGGACIARNEGVKVASGEYIFFLDDDDEFLPDKVKIQSAFLKNNKEYDGCLAAFKRIDGTTRQEIIATSNFPNIGDYKNFVIHGNFFTPMLCIRKDALIRIGGFDIIARFQDRFLMLKALKNDLSFAIIDVPLHIMYEHNDFRITGTNSKKSIMALDIIQNNIIANKAVFTQEEWKQYLIKDYRMRAVIYYNAPLYQERLKAIPLFYKSFRLSKDTKDIKMLLKSLVKFNRL